MFRRLPRRLAVLLLLGPQLDANYLACAASHETLSLSGGHQSD
jgi:hypothetical protein